MLARTTSLTLSLVWGLVICAVVGAYERPNGAPAAEAERVLAPLADQLQVSEIPVDATIELGTGEDNPANFWGGQQLRPVVCALQPNGGAKIGWTDSDGRIHITPVHKGDRRAGEDLVIEYGLLRDLVAHDDGYAALVLQNGGMNLIRVRGEETVFQTRLISNWSSNIHLGSLAWNGQRYAAYFAIHGGGHEGDALKYVNADGDLLDGGWNWGCSHSIDMRVVCVDDRFMPIALSDAYPGTGIFFNYNEKRVTYCWGDRSGGTGGRIGGMVALGDKMFVAFSSMEGRNTWSAGLADFTQKAPYEQSIHKYLKEADVNQINVKIARYGNDQLLLSWRDEGSERRKFQRYDAAATRLGDVEELQVRASPRGDMKTDTNGDVVWAHAWGDQRKTLKVVRIAK